MKMNNEAVSPVVGVMLMLVVTIIIAAVVSAFAGGMSEGTTEAPQASIDVDINYNVDSGMGWRATEMTFKLLSGDPLPTKDLSIITYYTNSSGYVYKNTQTASSAVIDTYAGTMYGGYGYDSRVPALNNLGKGWATESQQWFGNYTWVVGDKMSTLGDAGTAQVLGMWDSFDSTGELDPDLKTGAVVDVKIMHIPSGKYIYNKEVIVS
jgi:FlaG/FlaF family flagellin (archaellin)